MSKQARTKTRSRMQDFLLLVLEERRYSADLDRGQVLAAHDGHGSSEAALSRLVAGQAKTSSDGIDAIVSAYAAALKTPASDLWAEAIKEWQADPNGLALEVRRAELAHRFRARAGQRARSVRSQNEKKAKKAKHRTDTQTPRAKKNTRARPP